MQIVALVHICARLGISLISYLWRFRSFLVKNFLSHWPQTNFLSRDPFMVLDPAWTFRWFISSSCKYKYNYKSSAPPGNTNTDTVTNLKLLQLRCELLIDKIVGKYLTRKHHFTDFAVKLALFCRVHRLIKEIHIIVGRDVSCFCRSPWWLNIWFST